MGVRLDDRGTRLIAVNAKPIAAWFGASLTTQAIIGAVAAAAVLLTPGAAFAQPLTQESACTMT